MFKTLLQRIQHVYDALVTKLTHAPISRTATLPLRCPRCSYPDMMRPWMRKAEELEHLYFIGWRCPACEAEEVIDVATACY